MQEIIVHVGQNKEKLVALVENGKLVEKYEETGDRKRLEGNIYLGKVENVLLGMQAAFVDIGEEKNTFIHIRDVIPRASNETGNKNEELSKHNIKNYIRVGMPILVQVKRDSTNRKGARVSTHISLSGRFAVVMPDAEFITVSQKIEDKAEINRLKGIVEKCIPEGFGAIIRTAANGKEEDQIRQDIEQIVAKIRKIQNKFVNNRQSNDVKPQILYKNDGLVSKILLDGKNSKVLEDVKDLDNNIDRIWVDDKEEYSKIVNFVNETNNSEKITVELKENDLITMYDLDDQIEASKNRKIWLRCGGFITIDKTEALTAIDVNSGKYIGSKDLEQTIFKVNKEASIEIAKQLRLRDIGGIVIIDYIDMEKQESKDMIENILKESLKKDRSKTQVIGFTPLNLLEMTRKHMCSND